MGENATNAIFAVSFFGALASLAFAINAIARAWVQRGRDEITLANQAATPLAEARFARLEQAVDAIAVEVERMSESQRYTARLLNEQAGSAQKASQAAGS